MLWLYRFLFIPALLVMAPRYVLRMRKRGGYGEKSEALDSIVEAARVLKR